MNIKAKKYVLSAETAQPNTPESDMQRTILHAVTLNTGEVIRLFATDPMDAIDRVQRSIQFDD